MSIYVADTHALLWYLFTPEKLGPAAQEVFQQIQAGNLLVIPAVVVAEMVMVVEKQRVRATLDELKMVISSLSSCPKITSAL